MFTVRGLRGLYLHQEWADARLWRAIGASGASSSASRLDQRIWDLLFHMHVTQRAFLQLWQQQVVAIPDPATLATRLALEAWAYSYHREATSWLANVREADLAEPFAVPSEPVEAQLGGKPHTATLGDTVYQVVSHGTYHRAQVNARLRELGATPPMLDYITWVWLDRPAPEWHHDGPADTPSRGGAQP